MLSLHFYALKFFHTFAQKHHMGNILTAIQRIIENTGFEIVDDTQHIIQNRANQMGEALEDYVKNAFADCIGKDIRYIKTARNQTFSYLGNSSNPPDAMLRGGDAIEIKKITSIKTPQLQFNSSYPKNKLYSDNPKICKKCKDCEIWHEKDMLYVVGQIDGHELHDIFFIYGNLYCDSPDVYENVENLIKESLNSLNDVEIANTKELGRINKVDHLEISDLRIRGMWLIKSPFHHFQYLTENITDYTFRLIALIPEDKYNNFENVTEFESFCIEKGISISDENIEDPQNPAELIDSKLIIYYH